MTQHRKRGTGCVVRRGEGYWVALAPQHRRGAKQVRIATRKTKSAATEAIDAWLAKRGRVLAKT